MKIIIPGNTIAKKNSQRIVRMGKIPSIRPSKAYDAWEKFAIQYLQYRRIRPWPGEYPVEVHFFFYRKTKAKFDLDNMICGSLDVLQKVGVLEDDSMRHVIPVIELRDEGYGWAIDRVDPRVEIQIVGNVVKK